MADTLLNKINQFRQRLDANIRKLASTEAPEEQKPTIPDHATPVMSPYGPYMHVWLEEEPSRVCLRLRNGYVVKLDQRVTPNLAIALLKLPYSTEPMPPLSPLEKET